MAKGSCRLHKATLLERFVKRMINRIKSAIKEPKKILIHTLRLKVFRFIPDRIFLKLIYRLYIGEKLDLKNPKTYCEKLQWLKLYDRNPEYTKYVDKFAVRSYIAQAIGEQYLVPLIGVYNSVNEINWDLLPDRFVLKCTHGSNSNIVCSDKTKLSIRDAKAKLNKWMKKNWYWYGREWPYKNVKPRIICEEFITSDGSIPEDYKVMCFHGQVKLIQVHCNRFSETHTCDNYDINWKKIDISKSKNGLPNSNIILERPKLFDKMVELSEQLSRNMRHVRIDWYIVGDKLFFGEITFYSSSGFSNYDKKEDDLLLGSWITI